MPQSLSHSVAQSASDAGKPDRTRSAPCALKNKSAREGGSISVRHFSSLGVTPSATRVLHSRNMRPAWSCESGRVTWHNAESSEERQGDQGSPGDAHVLHGSVAPLHFLRFTLPLYCLTSLLPSFALFKCVWGKGGERLRLSVITSQKSMKLFIEKHVALPFPGWKIVKH